MKCLFRKVHFYEMPFLHNTILLKHIFMKYQKYNLSNYHKYILYIIGKSKNDKY